MRGLKSIWMRRRTFDARHNRPRTGRVLIATGRDAVDVAFSTLYGHAQLLKLQVWADEAPEDFQLDGETRMNAMRSTGMDRRSGIEWSQVKRARFLFHQRSNTIILDPSVLCSSGSSSFRRNATARSGCAATA